MVAYALPSVSGDPASGLCLIGKDSPGLIGIFTSLLSIQMLLGLIFLVRGIKSSLDVSNINIKY